MATSVHLSSKMVFEFVDPSTKKKSRFTFPYIKKDILETQFLNIAAMVNNLQNDAYTNLIKTEEYEIY